MPAMQQTRTRRGSKESQAVTSVLHALLRAQQTMCAVLIEAETRHVWQHALKSHENHPLLKAAACTVPLKTHSASSRLTKKGKSGGSCKLSPQQCVRRA